jgi:hypothetical protein
MTSQEGSRPADAQTAGTEPPAREGARHCCKKDEELVSPPHDGTSQLFFAQACLDYTMRTSQVNETRMTKLLTVAISALAGAAFLLREIVAFFAGPMESAARSGFAYGVLVATTATASLLLILTIFVLFRGITPKTVDSASRLLNDYIAGIPTSDYLGELGRMNPLAGARAILTENAAMAKVVLARQGAYKLCANIFYCGGGLLSLSYFSFVLYKVVVTQ